LRILRTEIENDYRTGMFHFSILPQY
jgi:hypothetical protein